MDDERQGSTSASLNVLGIPSVPTFPRPSRQTSKRPGSVSAWFFSSDSGSSGFQGSRSAGPSKPGASRQKSNSAKPSSSSARKQPSSSKSQAKFRWMKGELIGSGSHGKVYMGFNATTGEVMAVKQVELPTTPSDRMKTNMKVIVDALKDERETLEGLDHDNIVQYLGFEENPETLNIFLQYVSGGTINQCLRKYGKFREDVTKYFTSQILEGLSYLHAQGIIHRDLKSDNILVEETGVCKISDFGISKKVQELDRAFSQMKGTSFWMAPEAVVGGDSTGEYQKGYTNKVDIWSVGCIVIEMWTGERPWFNQAIFPVFIKLLEDKAAPPLPEGMQISDLAESFRAESFHPDPAKRSSASYLLNHAYLILPPGWSFPEMSNMGQKLPDASQSDIEEIANIMSEGLTMRPPDAQQRRPTSPAMTMMSEVRFSNDSRQSRATIDPTPQGPPTVFIQPPAPRPQKIIQRTDDWTVRAKPSSASESSGSQRSSQSFNRGGTRRLMVYNPDEAEKNRRRPTPKPAEAAPLPPPYVYEPPPLPGLPGGGERTPYSNHLAPLAPNRFAPPSPPSCPPAHSPPRARSSISQGKLVASSSTSQHRDDYYDGYSDTESDYTSTTSSTWKKPPVDIAMSRRLSRDDTLTGGARWPPSQPRNDMNIAPHGANHLRRTSNLGDTRPAVKEVLENLESFFPSHNLDAVVESPLEGDNVRQSGTQAPIRLMKSVKTIAEEQIGSPVRRRQTRLWDIQPEEIKAPR